MITFLHAKSNAHDTGTVPYNRGFNTALKLVKPPTAPKCQSYMTNDIKAYSDSEQEGLSKNTISAVVIGCSFRANCILVRLKKNT